MHRQPFLKTHILILYIFFYMCPIRICKFPFYRLLVGYLSATQDTV
jgi:hypothetical protein